jgi:hypothetical protein
MATSGRTAAGQPYLFHRPPTTDHRPPTTDHRQPTTDNRQPTTLPHLTPASMMAAANAMLLGSADAAPIT